MKTSYVYILECSDSSYYTGVTSNLEKRIIQHQMGSEKDSYTSKRLPVVLVYCQQFMDISQAIAWEKRIKKWSQKKKRALIDGNWEKLKEYSQCKNESSHWNYKYVRDTK
jgi:putative endonuclease